MSPSRTLGLILVATAAGWLAARATTAGEPEPGTWDIYEYADERETHVIPTLDDIDHDHPGDGCVCGPTLEQLDDGTWQYAHQSLTLELADQT